MPKAVICVGISGSGKTTWAEAQEGFVNINRDDIREFVIGKPLDWRTYKFKKSVENRVTEVQKQLAFDAVVNNEDVIISDTNLNKSVRMGWVGFFEDYGYEVEIKEFPVTLEEAWKRNAYRLNGVNNHVVYQQHRKWLEYKGRNVYSPDFGLPKVVMFDIDGTLADHKGIRSPFDWESVDQDRTKHLIVDMLHGYQAQGYNIVIMSGRDSCCRELTEMWLSDQGIDNYELFMRPENDRRKDTVVKEELFWGNVADRYNVCGVVDDRPSVVRLWYELRIPNVISVGNPWVEF